MSGTVAGGKTAAKTNKSKYGKDFYAKIGAMGGKKGHTGGFYANRELARIAGARGGRNGKRGPNRPKEVVVNVVEPEELPIDKTMEKKVNKLFKLLSFGR